MSPRSGDVFNLLFNWYHLLKGWHHWSHGRGDWDQMVMSHPEPLSSPPLVHVVLCLSYLSGSWGSSSCAAAIKMFFIAFGFQNNHHKLNQCAFTSHILRSCCDWSYRISCYFTLQIDWFGLKRLCSDFSKVSCGGCLNSADLTPLINTLPVSSFHPLYRFPKMTRYKAWAKALLFWQRSNIVCT